jgi:hypothetical protein
MKISQVPFRTYSVSKRAAYLDVQKIGMPLLVDGLGLDETALRLF